jgi:hypothetical protein
MPVLTRQDDGVLPDPPEDLNQGGPTVGPGKHCGGWTPRPRRAVTVHGWPAVAVLVALLIPWGVGVLVGWLVRALP